MSRKSDLRRVLASRPRILLLDLLHRRGRQTSHELAERVGVHSNTVREHLYRLVDHGLVVRAPEIRTIRGRPHILFSAAQGLAGTCASVREETARAISLGRVYRSVYRPGAEPEPGSAQLDVIEDYLDRAGFEPEVAPDVGAIGLRCPLLALRGAVDQETLCAVCRKVMSSVLARADGPLRVAGAKPRDDAGAACTVTLSSGS